MLSSYHISSAGVILVAGLWTSTVIASPRVSTTSGILNGVSNGSVNVFLGVPYSQPPVGNLRWRIALPVNASGTEVNATRFGAACGQLSASLGVFLRAGISTLPTKQSEDCLFLNIWAPQHRYRLPVIVFIHGGGYLSGSSNETMYSGEYMASTGRAIFVSLNYRLNILGFPSTTAIDGIDQNVGITDVRLALEWLVENIAQFGGDPSRMIITGESSGAHMAELLLFAYEKNPIVYGEIGSSGAIGMFTTNPTDGAVWNAVSDASGCGNVTDALQISCMRNVSFDDIMGITVELSVSFMPTADGSIVFNNETYLARGATGSFSHVPAFLTNTNNEGSLFVEPYSSLFPSGTTQEEASDALACPTAAEAFNKHRAGIPTWRARYFAQWPNLTPFPNDSSIGAYHGADVYVFFGTIADVHLGNSTAKPTEAERKLSSRYMDAWLTFAEDPKEGLSKRLGWPLYDPMGNTLMKIGEHNSSSITFGPSTQYDSTCPK
jgi:carboxylesterase type B